MLLVILQKHMSICLFYYNIMVLLFQITKGGSPICFLFGCLHLQVETVRSIFERHPDIAVGFHSKNQHLRKACMDSLLCLIETMCQSLQELSSEDLVQADVALTSLKDLGFKLDWLEKKLDQVKVNKEKEMSCLAILQETEESLLNLKQKCSELKAELTETKTPLSFDDVV